MKGCEGGVFFLEGFDGGAFGVMMMTTDDGLAEGVRGKIWLGFVH